MSFFCFLFMKYVRYTYDSNHSRNSIKNNSFKIILLSLLRTFNNIREYSESSKCLCTIYYGVSFFQFSNCKFSCTFKYIFSINVCSLYVSHFGPLFHRHLGGFHSDILNCHLPIFSIPLPSVSIFFRAYNINYNLLNSFP